MSNMSYRREPALGPYSNVNLPNKSKSKTRNRRMRSKDTTKSSARSAKKAQTPGNGRVLNESNSEQSVHGERLMPTNQARDNIRVLVRIRPRNSKEKAAKEDGRVIVKATDLQTVLFDQKEEVEDFYFHGVKQKDLAFTRRRNKDMSFGFDYVFAPNSNNLEIFETCLKNIVGHVIGGYNCSVFAYGATGSGKTFTMLGSADNPGLTFLMAKELSHKIKQIANEFDAEILVSYLEIYNENLKDLLSPSACLSIREDGIHGVNIPNLTWHKIQDTSDLLNMLSQGNSRRTQHPTDHNAESSRSHAVFQVFVDLRRRITRNTLGFHRVKAKLVMVDLAGSERGATNGPNSDRCREGANINKSLLALGNCINALADGKSHIPFRDSKLTRMLKDSLGGNCKTVMIANVSPTFLTYDDTYNTLKYADRAKEIKVNSKKNVSTDPAGTSDMHKLIKELRMENSELKVKLQTQMDLINNYKTMFEQNQYSKAMGCISTDAAGFVPPVQKIHDPASMEQFIQLISQKKTLEEAHVYASINAKEAEWFMLWKRWRIQSITGLGKVDSEHIHTYLDRLKHQYENLSSKHIQYKEKVQLERKLVHFNDKEISVTWKTLLSSLKMEDPFLTLTLREYLNYSSLEREVGTHKCVENYHQKMCSRILEELVNTEFILAESLRYVQFLSRGLAEQTRIQPTVRDRKYKALLDKLYKNNKESRRSDSMDKKMRKSFPEDLVEALRQVIHHPVVEYEAPAIEDGSQRSKLDITDSSATSIIPIHGSQLAVQGKVPYQVGSSHSDIFVRRSVSQIIAQTKTIPPPPREASFSRGSDSDCHSLPFSFTQQMSEHPDPDKTSSETSLESQHIQRSCVPVPATPKPASNQISNSSLSTSEDNLLISVQESRPASYSSEEEHQIPLKRAKAELIMPSEMPSRRAKVHPPIQTPSPRSIPNHQHRSQAHPPQPTKHRVESHHPTDNYYTKVPERKPRHQIPEPDLTPRNERRHQVELVEMNRRKRRGDNLGDGDEGSGDYADQKTQPSNQNTQFWSNNDLEEVSDIISPPSAFGNAQSKEQISARSRAYYVYKSPPTPVYTDNDFTEDED